MPTTQWRSPTSSSCRPGSADGRAADPRSPARRRGAVGDDFSAWHRAPDHLAHPVDQAGRAGRGGWLRSKPGARQPGRTPTSAWTSSCAAKAKSRSVNCCARSRAPVPFRRSPGSGSARAPPSVAMLSDLSHRSKRAASARRTGPPACSPAIRCSAVPWMSSKRHGAAPSTAASVRSSRCAAATFTGSRSSVSSTTSPMRAGAARGPSSSLTTTSRSTWGGSRRCAARSSRPDSTTRITSCRR